jgi:hypothetical protein
MKPPIIIVGAPRSGTTAYMRYVASQNSDYLVLKEDESFWSSMGKRRPGRLRVHYARKLVNTSKTGIIDKNVRNTFRVGKIHSMYTAAQFINVIRDGRAAISSWRDWAVKTGKSDTSIAGAAKQWVRYVTHMLNNKHLLKNYKEVRYEELCFKYDYFKSRNNKWKKRISDDELKTIMDIAGPLLRKLGYV